ncbi:MAG: FISUMP domain-containing protein [Bacteroidota bacterium]|jgi:uncharacterized protein (TIGR02145 family)
MKAIFISLFLLGFFSGYSQFLCGSSTVTDIDGNVYHTVQIGTQCWMKENMNTLHYSNGTVVSVPEDQVTGVKNVINRPGDFRINVFLPGNAYDVNISLFDMTGRVKYGKRIFCENGSNSLECTIGPSGVYLLVISIGNINESFKVTGTDSKEMEVKLIPFTPNLKSITDTIRLNSDSRYAFDYDNDPSNGAIYGKLYTALSALNTKVYNGVIQGVCPNGWHIPGDQEWQTMELFAGMSTEEANKMMEYRGTIAYKFKTMGTDFWVTAKGTDEFGFSAKGSGKYSIPPFCFNGLKLNGTWWTYGFDNLMDRQLTDYQAGVWRGITTPDWAVSVRCIKD